MTREEVEDYFEQVTGHSIFGGEGHEGRMMYLSPDEVHAFASGIAADERERCARICDETRWSGYVPPELDAMQDAITTGTGIMRGGERIDPASIYKSAAFPGEAVISQSPKPVGYWVLYPGITQKTKFAIYKRPTDEQIKNTEQLLGWGWEAS